MILHQDSFFLFYIFLQNWDVITFFIIFLGFSCSLVNCFTKKLVFNERVLEITQTCLS